MTTCGGQCREGIGTRRARGWDTIVLCSSLWASGCWSRTLCITWHDIGLAKILENCSINSLRIYLFCLIPLCLAWPCLVQPSYPALSLFVFVVLLFLPSFPFITARSSPATSCRGARSGAAALKQSEWHTHITETAFTLPPPPEAYRKPDRLENAKVVQNRACIATESVTGRINVGTPVANGNEHVHRQELVCACMACLRRARCRQYMCQEI